jgi:RNA polymerase sigma-70 factor (ECF subfamily)
VTHGDWEVKMRAALAGDAVAYRTLLAEISPFVRAVVRRSLGKSARPVVEAEDIVQDVLLAVHLKRRTWDPARPLAPWLGAITRHKVIDSLRKHGMRPTVSVDEIADILPGTDIVEPAAGDAERMMAALPERQRHIIQAITLQERSAADVGSELGMSEGAVRVALHRAIKALARQFGADRT